MEGGDADGAGSADGSSDAADAADANAADGPSDAGESANGDAGLDGKDGDDGVPNLPGPSAVCIAKTNKEVQTVFVGTGFEAYEGMLVFVGVIDSSFQTCHTRGAARIRGGAFSIAIVGRVSGVYPTYYAFVDVDRNGRCSPTLDVQWLTVFTLTKPITTFNLAPADLTTKGDCPAGT